MAKLKLGVVLDDRPVKLTLEVSAATHRDLVRYADYLNRRHVTVTFYAGGTPWRS